MLTSLAIGLGLNGPKIAECKGKIDLIFYQYDRNPSSTLTSSEFCDLIDDMIKHKDFQDNCQKLKFDEFKNLPAIIFNKIDLDGDKRLDVHEFYAAAIDHKDLFSDKVID